MSLVKYTIDPAHTSVHFSVRHMMVSNVRGEFTKVAGSLTFDHQNPSASTVEATIEVASINTRNPDRDGHLKSPEFLDDEKFPTITFISTRIEPTLDGGKITGELTIHGVTHPITLEVEGPGPEVKDPWGMLRIGASATAKLSRGAFGLTWNNTLEAGGVLIGDEVKITIDIEAVRS